jgi:hypothetical protein
LFKNKTAFGEFLGLEEVEKKLKEEVVKKVFK